VDEAKPFKIPKREIWEAFKRVKANQGAAGVDGQSIAAFEANLSGNLYKLWNRMSSGSYFPPPVRRVDIPKAGGGTRPLGKSSGPLDTFRPHRMLFVAHPLVWSS
jgi:RNA-directed DNA polymerase